MESDNNELARRLKDLREDTKQEIEILKAKMKRVIPTAIQDMRGTIGFVKLDEASVEPVMVVSPFDIEPGPVRNDYIRRVEEVSMRLAYNEMLCTFVGIDPASFLTLPLAVALSSLGVSELQIELQSSFHGGTGSILVCDEEFWVHFTKQLFEV